MARPFPLKLRPSLGGLHFFLGFLEGKLFCESGAMAFSFFSRESSFELLLDSVYFSFSLTDFWDLPSSLSSLSAGR